MTWQSGGGGGQSIPGLTSDGHNGIVVADAVTAGDATATTVPTIHDVFGVTDFRGGGAIDIDGDTAVAVNTGVDAQGHVVTSLTDDSDSGVASFFRYGVSNGNVWTSPVVDIRDQTDDTSGRNGVLSVTKSSLGPFDAVVLYVDQTGIFTTQNVRIKRSLAAWNHAPPVAQPTLATGAGLTVDDVITLLQSYGLCKQA